MTASYAQLSFVALNSAEGQRDLSQFNNVAQNVLIKLKGANNPNLRMDTNVSKNGTSVFWAMIGYEKISSSQIFSALKTSGIDYFPGCVDITMTPSPYPRIHITLDTAKFAHKSTTHTKDKLCSKRRRGSSRSKNNVPVRYVGAVCHDTYNGSDGNLSGSDDDEEDFDRYNYRSGYNTKQTTSPRAGLLEKFDFSRYAYSFGVTIIVCILWMIIWR